MSHLFCLVLYMGLQKGHEAEKEGFLDRKGSRMSEYVESKCV